MKQEMKKSILNYSLNITIVLFALICIYLIFSLLYNSLGNKNDALKEVKDSTKSTLTNLIYPSR